MITDLLSITRQPDCMTGTGLRLFGVNNLHANSCTQPSRYALAIFVAEACTAKRPLQPSSPR